MKKIDIVFVLISVLIAGLCYVTTLNLIYPLITLLLFVLDYFIFLRKKFTEYNSTVDRVHICYHFINSFIVTLSVKESLEDAYLNAIRIKNKKFEEITDGIKNNNVAGRIYYLKDFFNLSIYRMFLNVFTLYQDQGGSILKMSDNLIRECTRTEKTLSETISIGFKHLIEYIVLWLLSFGILVFMRFSIKDFYLDMLKNKVVGLMIFVFYLLALVSMNLFVSSFTNLTIKKDNDLCKNSEKKCFI